MMLILPSLFSLHSVLVGPSQTATTAVLLQRALLGQGAEAVRLPSVWVRFGLMTNTSIQASGKPLGLWEALRQHDCAVLFTLRFESDPGGISES